MLSLDATNYLTLEPSLSWRVTPDLSLSAGLRYTLSETKAIRADAEAKSAYVLLRYAWPKISLPH